MDGKGPENGADSERATGKSFCGLVCIQQGAIRRSASAGGGTRVLGSLADLESIVEGRCGFGCKPMCCAGAPESWIWVSPFRKAGHKRGRVGAAEHTACWGWKAPSNDSSFDAFDDATGRNLDHPASRCIWQGCDTDVSDEDSGEDVSFTGPIGVTKETFEEPLGETDILE